MLTFSGRRTVTDEHQTENNNDVDENTPASELLALRREKLGDTTDGHLSPSLVARDPMPSILVHSPVAEEGDVKRPKVGGIAYPFSLKTHGATASMTTLTSAIGVPPADDVRTAGAKESGVGSDAADVETSKLPGNSSEEAETTVENEKQPERNSAFVNESGDEATLSNGQSKAVENDEVVSQERPPLETFVTAKDDLPTVS